MPESAGQAVAAAREILGWVARSDARALTADEQAECLRELERAESALTAARAVVLAAFDADCGFHADGHGSARTWLKWQTRVTGAAAGAAVGWMRRLSDHPAVGDTLGTGTVSPSWARAICDWTDLLPAGARGDGDVILLAAAAAGARLSDLAGLAEELRDRTARPDADDDDGFDDRSVRLDLHYRGAGKLGGDLTPRCAAAVQAVLDALGKKAGPEDTRTRFQRQHDALEEAMRRLIAAGCLPARAGQPTQIQLTMTLDQLTGPGDARGPAAPGPRAQSGDECDASIVPVVTGHVDHELLDELAATLTGSYLPCTCPLHGAAGSVPCTADLPDSTTDPPPGADGPDDLDRVNGGNAAWAAPEDRGTGRGDLAGHHSERGPLLSQNAARELVLRRATALLSGPVGLAARLRTGTLAGPAASVSLPLDIGTATDTIPTHLRRAVIARDRHCAFPGGCDQPSAACQVHHLIPRSQGGRTILANLGLFCTFHHLIVIHRWGWEIALNADGTMTATSPDRTRMVRSHSPPPATAA